MCPTCQLDSSLLASLGGISLRGSDRLGPELFQIDAPANQNCNTVHGTDLYAVNSERTVLIRGCLDTQVLKIHSRK